VDEFTQPVREAEAIHRDTTRLLIGTIGASIQGFQKTGLVVMGLGIVVASLLALCVGRYFSRTIGRLREATSRVNAGDYAVRVRPSMSGEIGTLVSDFNTMVAQLEATTVSKHRLEESEEKLRQTNAELLREITERTKAEGALKEAHNQLERRVEERTDELQQAYAKLVEEVKGREQLEAQLRQAQKMEAVGTLAGGIAHDFNNILAAIIGFTELAIDDAPEGSLLRPSLDRVLSASLRGRDLVKQILTFSRKEEQERQCVALTPLVEDALRFLKASLPAAIEIEFDSSGTTDLVLADPTQIHQVLMNLVTNAAFAMGKKGGLLEIQMSDTFFSSSEVPGLQAGPYVKLSVRDTGCGMDKQILDRIFDPFFTTKKSGEGTGLGLSVVHGIVKAHQGAITVSSEPGEGSTFTVFLPKVAHEQKAQPEMTGEIAGGTERVLFVDDEQLLVELAREMLGRLGYEVVATTDAGEALTVFSGEPDRFQCVITDYTMPKATGVELAKSLMRIRPDIPIVLCTGYTEMISRDKARTLGIREFVTKPLVKREIAETIRRVLDTKAQA
jgi:signal transduction histidine kinase/ActR/RegA family two-component response regulator